MLHATAAGPIASAELFVIVDRQQTVHWNACERAAARRRARGVAGARRGEDRRGPHVPVRHERGDRRPVGRAVSSPAVDLGSAFKSGQITWTSSAYSNRGALGRETEIWCDSRLLQGVYRRGNSFQSVLAKLDSPASFETFKDWLTTNPQLNVQVAARDRLLRRAVDDDDELIRGIGYGDRGPDGHRRRLRRDPHDVHGRVDADARDRDASGARLQHVVGARLGSGRVAGACRTRAASLGGAARVLAFNGYQTSTMNFQTFSQVAFAFAVTPALLMQGLSYALAMGLVGGLLPAIRAARLPISSALREL